LSLRQPELQLRGATASLERQRTLKRCRHLLDAWGAQRLATLEHCIARLLQEEATPAGAPDTATAGDALLRAAGADMEARIEALFAELNGDALRFQQAYYSERRYLNELDQHRCAAFEEIVSSEGVLQPAA
jgi:DNA primase